jgi:methylenetetrahydrofolate dehydrogenase (NADP+)/methenyltetrahydrofolate cyclohydrolase
MPNLIDGREIAQKLYGRLRDDIAQLKAKGITPGLAVVLVGDDPASRTYVGAKDKMSRELGLHSA